MSQDFKTIEEFHDHLRKRSVEDEAFRARLLSDPKAVIEDELSLSVPDDFTVKVHEESSTTAHIVLPPSPALAEEEMRGMAGGRSGPAGGSWCSPI